MLKRGARGSEVKRLQEALIEIGYPLPRWGVDGDLGDETLSALELFLAIHGKGVSDGDKNTVSKRELEFVYTIRDALREPAPTPSSLVDIRSQASRVHVGGRRTWKQVTGICLHQSACVLGERPQRWATVGAHLGVTRGGKVIWIHDFDWVVWHGNGWNSSTVGIEMDGTYAGIEGNDRTFWRPKEEPNRKPQTPTPELITSAQETIRWICAEVAKHGGKVKMLVAHRQSSRTRQSDPGSALWQAVALPLQKELGLTDGGKGYKIGTGMPIPEAWNPKYVGVKY